MCWRTHSQCVNSIVRMLNNKIIVFQESRWIQNRVESCSTVQSILRLISSHPKQHHNRPSCKACTFSCCLPKVSLPTTRKKECRGGPSNDPGSSPSASQPAIQFIYYYFIQSFDESTILQSRVQWLNITSTIVFKYNNNNSNTNGSSILFRRELQFGWAPFVFCAPSIPIVIWSHPFIPGHWEDESINDNIRGLDFF